jgi:hypothetical protein
MKILTNPRHIFIGFLVIFFLHIALYLFLFTRADRITPPGHVHTIHPLDAYYPDVIRQSKLGAWSIIDTHTTLPTPRILSYFFFVAAGKVAAVFSIDPVVMYEITRFAGGIAVLVATYWLITLILPVPLQLVGLFFTMVFDTGPVWEAVMKTPIWQWTAASPGQILTARHFGFPHHLWGEAFGLALICMVIRAIKKPGHLTPLIIVFLGLASVSTSPPYPVILITCLFGPWLIWALITKNIKKTFPPIVLAVGAIIAGGLFIKLQFAKGPPMVDHQRNPYSIYSVIWIVLSFCCGCTASCTFCLEEMVSCYTPSICSCFRLDSFTSRTYLSLKAFMVPNCQWTNCVGFVTSPNRNSCNSCSLYRVQISISAS